MEFGFGKIGMHRRLSPHGPKTAIAWTVLGGIAALLAGCIDTPGDRLVRAERIASAAGLQESQVNAGDFRLVAFWKITAPGSPLVVYIEGDGFAWVTRTRLSSDPTPLSPLALSLASLDPSPNVLYLGRPCQYIGVSDNSKCDASMWSDARYSDTVVDAISRAIDDFGGRVTAPTISLIGYSGGAAVAILVAARRHDVASIRTIAGNLDHAAFTHYHQVSPLIHSLNPADAAPAVAGIPQLHLVGAQDDIVPPVVAESYARHAGNRRCIDIRIVAGVSHGDGWTAIWPSVTTESPRCHD